MKKIIVLIAVAFTILNVNTQTTDNFCDPELKSKIESITKLGGTYLKDFYISNNKAGEFHQKFSMLLQKGNYYRFYLLSSINIPCETKLTLSFKENNTETKLLVIKQKSNDPVAYYDIEIKKTGAYEVIVSFTDNTKGCALVLINFMSQKDDIMHNGKVDTAIIYNEVEVNAKFNNGDLNNFRNYIAQSYKVDTNLLKGVTGNIFIEFVVNTKGRVESAKILRSSGVTYFDKQAIEVVKSSTGWTPAIVKGVAVKQSFVLPIKFK